MAGYDVAWLEEAGGPTISVALYWRPIVRLSQTLKLSLRLQHPDGTPVVWPDQRAVSEDDFPLRQVAKSPAWLAGELIRDVHTLRVPAESRGEPVRLQVIVYDADSVAEVGRWQIDIH